MSFFENIGGSCIVVVYKEFPKGSEGVHEIVTQNNDLSYTVFIDENLTSEGKDAAYLHALRHIFQDDFGKLDASAIEKSAH